MVQLLASVENMHKKRDDLSIEFGNRQAQIHGSADVAIGLNSPGSIVAGRNPT